MLATLLLRLAELLRLADNKHRSDTPAKMKLARNDPERPKASGIVSLPLCAPFSASDIFSGSRDVS
jgi:hypothetical protein